MALATPALAAPAGDEYLPSVPKAAGKELSAGQNTGGTILEPAVRGAHQTARGSQKGGSPNSADPSQNTSSSDNSSGASALLDPIVLLVIAGVIAATAGMLLRRRGADAEPAKANASAGGTPSAERPTPDGRIFDGQDEPATRVASDPGRKAGA